MPSAQLAVSPDGASVVFVAKAPGGPPSSCSSAGSTTSRLRRCRAPDDASYPFWSPDSRQVGFFADQQLKTVAIAGGPPQSHLRGCQWPRRRLEHSRRNHFRARQRPPAVPRQHFREETLRACGRCLPGTAVIAGLSSCPASSACCSSCAARNQNVAGIYVMSLDNPQHPQRLRGAVGNGLYASNHLLYVQDGELVAEHFDPETLRLSGQTLPLDLPVSGSSTFYSAFSVSDDRRPRHLGGWRRIERAGLVQSRRCSRIGTGRRPGTLRRFPALARRATALRWRASIRARIRPTSGSSIWCGRFPRRSPRTRETEATPVWAASGKRLIFRSNRNGKVHETLRTPCLRAR